MLRHVAFAAFVAAVGSASAQAATSTTASSREGQRRDEGILAVELSLTSSEAKPALSLSKRPPYTAVGGRAIERGTRRPVRDVAVSIDEIETFTDGRGNFTLTHVPSGSVVLRADAPGHDPLELPLELHEGAELSVTLWLERRRDPSISVVVSGKRRSAVQSVALAPDEISQLPGTLGDPLKALQNLPSTGRGAFGLGGLVIRGSAQEDSAVYLDGHEIPQLFHFAGISSVVSGEALEEIELTPSNFGARYGRATGGVVELKTRTGSSAPHGFLDVDFVDVTFLAEAEVAGGGLLVAGRRSWVDTFFALVLSALGEDVVTAPRLYDYLARYEHAALGGSLVTSFVGSDDRFELYTGDQNLEDRPLLSLTNGFHRLQLAHDARLSESVRTKVSIAAERNEEAKSVGSSYASELVELALMLRAELGYHSGGFRIEGGFDGSYDQFTHHGIGALPRGSGSIIAEPDPVPSPASGLDFGDGGDSRDDVERTTDRTSASPAVWIESTIEALDRLQGTLGARFEHHGLVGQSTVEPRFNFDVEPLEGLHVVGGIGLYSNVPPPPFFADAFGNPELSVERATQTSAGVRIELPLDLELSLDAYTKWLRDVAVEGPAGGPPIVSTGVGRVMGGEVFLRRRLVDGVFGWISYAISRSERAPFEDAEADLFAQDQTHAFTLVASYTTPDRWTFGVRLRYASGFPHHPVDRAIFDSDRGDFVPLRARVASERLPSFLQLDARIHKEWVFQEVIATAFVDVQNVTNRTNAEGWQYNFDYTERVPLDGLPILPTAGVRIQF
ncbi:MAG: TonB-dependent receptor [Deltaproteobacteria bacterium]|nr:TonB-dependent receptor [Deltaproteobacteria bacterium]